MEEALSLRIAEITPRAPCNAVRVTTRARLHFGFFDPSGRGQQPFGSFGLGLDRPVTRVSLARQEQPSSAGPEGERALAYLETLTARFGLGNAYAITVEEAIPSHAGLGSGTQLALAVGAAFAALEGLQLSPPQIAAALGRGRRSGIGIGTFASGGVVIDDGPRQRGLPPILARAPFPPSWRVLLIFHPDLKGLHGNRELAAFTEAPAFPETETAKLKQRALEHALPALAAEDFDAFCDEVGHLQEVMGEYFAPFQGGALVSPYVAGAIRWLKNQGIQGVGQSSWGPTGFALLGSETEGEELLAQMQSRNEFAGLRFELGGGCNEGARIETG